MANIEGKILRYKKYLDSYQNDKCRVKEVYQILKKLDNLPVTLEHLQSTGIGKSVNSYRKHSGDIGEEARSIVAKWKCLIPGVGCGQPSPSIQCETISETSYHGSEERETQNTSLPCTQRVPYLDSNRTASNQTCDEVVTDRGDRECASSPGDVNHNCKDGHEQSCDKVRCDDGNVENNICPQLDGEQMKKDTCRDLREGQKVKSSKEKKSKHKDKNHESGSHKHSKHSRHSHKDTKKRKSGDKAEESKDKDRGITEKPLTSHQSVRSPSHSGSNSEKPHSYEGSSSVNPKTNSLTETKSSRTTESHPEDRTTGDKASSQKKHKSKRDQSHSSKDTSSKHSSKKKAKFSSADGVDSSSNTEKCSLNGSHSSSKSGQQVSEEASCSIEKLGSFKEKLSRFSDNIKKVGSNMHAQSSSPEAHGIKRSTSQGSPHLTDNDKPLNDIQVSKEKVTSQSQGVKEADHATKRKSVNSDSGSKEKKTKLGSDSEGLSFEDLLSLDEELLKKSGKNKKPNPQTANSSKSKPADLSNKDKSHRRSDDTAPKRSLPEGHHSSKKSPSNHGKLSHSKHVLAGGTNNQDNEQKSNKRKDAEFCVPKASDKKMKLTEADILGGLCDTNITNHTSPLLKVKEMNRFQNKVDSTADHFLSKRNTRTQVYSGKRTNAFHEMPKLRDVCLRVLMDNIDDIENVGNVPFEVLKPVLERCSSSQLYTIEEYNPQFIEKSGGLWEKLCRKDFRNEKPEEFESWRELYLRKHDEREARLKRLTTNIAVSFARKQEPVKKTKLAFVDSVAKPPRNVLRQQKKHGTAGLEHVSMKLKKRPF